MEYEPFKVEYAKIKSFLDETFIPPIHKMHQETTDYISSFAMLYGNWKAKLLTLGNNADAFNLTAKLHRDIETRIDKQNQTLNNELSFTQYDLLNNFLNECLLSFEEKSILNQEPFHFNPIENDSTKVRSQKKISLLVIRLVKNLISYLREKKKSIIGKEKFH